MPHLFICTLVTRKCSHHLTDCPDSFIWLEKEYKMFTVHLRKLPNIVCSLQERSRPNCHYIKGSSEKTANVARAPDETVTIIFFEDLFWSHTKKAETIVQMGIRAHLYQLNSWTQTHASSNSVTLSNERNVIGLVPDVSDDHCAVGSHVLAAREEFSLRLWITALLG